MRISEQQRYKVTNNRVDDARSNNAKSLEQISTLKRINRISDDPIGASKVLRGRNRISNLETFQKNVEFSKGFLEKSESAVRSISDNLIRAKELAINLGNASYDAGSRSATAKEVKQIINEVVKLANTNFANRYVFSGFRTGTPALSEEGKYLGDDGAMFLQVEDGDFRQANIQARYLFEADPFEREKGHFNMVDSLEVLYQGLVSDDVEGIRRAMDELEFQLDKTTSYQATLGALFSALESSRKQLENDAVDAQADLSKIEEVDMFKATSDFHGSEAILQSTLLASNKMLQPSLLNFMQ